MSTLSSRLSFSRILLTVTFVFLFAAIGLAQSAGYGDIVGTVTDQSGAVVANAKVLVENSSKGIHRELTTSGAGVYSAQALVPADGYTVIVTAPNFGKYEVRNITLIVGQTVTINAALKPAAAGTTVEVTGEAPVVDFAKTDTSTVVGSTQILELPSNGRRVDQFVLLNPGVTNDAAFGLISFRGNPGGNTFLTDGVDTTNSYYGENAGRTRTYNISQDAVQEFQVVTANFAAEYGKASGGVINTVTRSGTNQFHGSAYEFWRNRTLNAIDASTVNGLTPKGINPPEWRHQAGLSIGGPIKKDKLFFFFNGELFRRNAPAVSSNIGAGSGNNLFDGSGNFWTTGSAKGNQTCVAGGTVKLPMAAVSGGSTVSVAGPTQAQCDAANAWVRSRVVPQLVDRHMDNNLLFFKLDYHPTSKDTISANFNYLDFRSPNGIQTQLSLSNGSALGNNADTNVFDRTGRLSWTRVIGASALNEFRFGIFKDRQIDPASQSLIPTFGPAGTAIAALTINGVSNLGDAVNYPRVNPSELRQQFADTFSFVKGKHSFKFGIDETRLEDYVSTLYGQFPSYTYTATTGTGAANAMTLFALDFNNRSGVGSQAFSGFSQTTGQRKVNYTIWESSFFAQDEWKVTPKLTITPGIRYEYTSMPTPRIGSSSVAGCNSAMDAMIQTATGAKGAGTCYIPTYNAAWSPRIGIAYALNNKTAIHAGYGIFQDRYTTSTIENLLVSTGLYQGTYSYSGSSYTTAVAGCLPVFPNGQAETWTPSGSCAKNLSPDIFFADPKYRNPYSQQATIAIEREIAKGTNLSVSYVWSRSLHINVSKDTNIALDAVKTAQYAIYSDAAATQMVRTSDVYPIYTAYNSAYGGYTGRVSELQSAGNSYYNALLVNLSRRYSSWFQGSASYTYGHTVDYGIGSTPTFGSTTPTSFYNDSYRSIKGSSALDRRHNLVINATFTPKFTNSNSQFAKQVVNGWTFSMVEQLATSQPTNPGFTFASGSSISGGRRGGLNGLGNSFIPFDSLSDLNIGEVIRTDARISKKFIINERVNVTAGIEAVNLLNTIIASGRASTKYTVCNIATTATSSSGGCSPSMGYVTTGTNTVYKLIPYASYGALTATQVTPDGTTARRAQAVIRINF